jgi:predicted PurR-regulated permease PerM
VLATAALAVAGVAVMAGPSIADAADGVVDDAPDAVTDMEQLPVVGAALEENGASERVEEALVALPDRLAGSGAVERIVSTAGDGALGLLWTLAVMLAVLLDGPRLVDAVARRVPLESRRRARRLGRATYTSLSNVAAAAAFVAVLNGSVVFLLALALGVPLAPVLGVWAMLWNFVPQVGGFVGAAPLVLLALAQGPWNALAAAVIFVCYQTFENHVIQPAMGSRAVHLPPLVVLIAVLIGGSVIGLVGAILAAPIAGVVKVLGTELRAHDGDRVEDRPIADPSD